MRNGAPTQEITPADPRDYPNSMGAKTGQRRPSRAVFIRRRIAVLLALIAIIGATVLIVAGPQTVASWFTVPANSEEPLVTAPPSTTDEGTSEPIQEVPRPTECEETALSVEPVLDETSYATDQYPRISLRVTNEGEVDCDADLGTSTMLYEIHSGPELYWNSTHCQKNPQSNPVRIRAGETLEAEPIEWNRTRSSPETCDVERSPVPAGGASYHLSVEIAGVASEPKQFLLY